MRWGKSATVVERVRSGERDPEKLSFLRDMAGQYTAAAAERVAMMRSLIAGSGGAGSAGGWSALWKEGLTLWDLSGPTAAALDEFNKASADGRLPPSGSKIFIPGCGSGYDVASLAKSERFKPSVVLGLDIAPEAVERARDIVGDTPGAEVVSGDFFTHPLEQFDLVFDYTFFCALPPSLRPKWGERTAALVKPGGRLLTLAFPLATDDMARDPNANGPPFPVSEGVYRDALEPHGLRLESGPYRNELSVRGAELVIWWLKEKQ